MKLVFKTFLTTVFLVGILTVGLFFFGNHLVANVLSESLGVPVKVQRLHLGYDAQSLGIYGLKILNPEGYETKTMAELPEIFVCYDLLSLLKDEITVHEVRLNVESIGVDINKNGRVNLFELVAMGGEGESSQVPQEEPTTVEEKKAKKIFIEEVVLNLGRVRYNNSKQGKVKEFSLGVENWTLRQVEDPSQIIVQIVSKTMQKVGLNALLPDLSQFSNAFKNQAQDALESTKSALQGLFKKK